MKKGDEYVETYIDSSSRSVTEGPSYTRYVEIEGDKTTRCIVSTAENGLKQIDLRKDGESMTIRLYDSEAKLEVEGHKEEVELMLAEGRLTSLLKNFDV